MTPEQWAITGANGYLGHALRADLAASSIPSRGLARSGGAEIVGDIRDRHAVAGLVRGATVVVHLAAYVHQGARGRRREAECWSVNVDGTQTLIDALQAGNPEAFAIFVSSANVYRQQDEPLDEEAPLSGRTPYGRSKLEAERRFQAAIAAGAIRGCILRPAVIFGPGAPGNMARLARMARSGWAVEIAGGAQRKSIVPVSHAVAAIRAVARCGDACNGEVFNVAGEALTIHEIIRALAGERMPRIISLPRWLAAPAARLVPAVAAYMASSVLSGEKLARLPGFHPAETGAEALSRLR